MSGFAFYSIPLLREAALGLAPGSALTAGVLALGLAAAVAWPGWGLLARLQRAGSLRARVRAEDALKHLYKAGMEGPAPTLESLAGAMEVTLNRAAETAAELQKAGFVAIDGARLQLTTSGERYALNIIRAHRLWEQHLAERTGVA